MMTDKKKIALSNIIALILTFVAVISAVTVLFVRAGYKHRYPQKYTEYIVKYSEEYSLLFFKNNMKTSQPVRVDSLFVILTYQFL